MMPTSLKRLSDEKLDTWIKNVINTLTSADKKVYVSETYLKDSKNELQSLCIKKPEKT